MNDLEKNIYRNYFLLYLLIVCGFSLDEICSMEICKHYKYNVASSNVRFKHAKLPQDLLIFRFSYFLNSGFRIFSCKNSATFRIPGCLFCFFIHFLFSLFLFICLISFLLTTSDNNIMWSVVKWMSGECSCPKLSK